MTERRKNTLAAIGSFMVVMTGGACDSITSLVGGSEPDMWVTTSVGYPFHAYYVMHRETDEVPEPDLLQPAALRAVERWSTVLAATPSATHTWAGDAWCGNTEEFLSRVPGSRELATRGDARRYGWAAGDTISAGFHVFIQIGPGPDGISHGHCGPQSGPLPVTGRIILPEDVPRWRDVRDIEQVLVHEIGHALGFSAGPGFPDTVAVLRVVNGGLDGKAVRVPLEGPHHWHDCIRFPDIMWNRGGDQISDATVAAMPHPWLTEAPEYSMTTNHPAECWRSP